MTLTLKPYNPSEKGKELIAVLFPLSHKDREKSISDYWKQYPQETGALLDGFHFMIQELIESRSTGEHHVYLNLPEELESAIFGNMQKLRNFFSYNNLIDFFRAVAAYKPTIFANPRKTNDIIEKVLATKPKHVSKFNLPERLDDASRSKMTETCQIAAEAYTSARKALPSIQKAQSILNRFKKGAKDITEMDVKLAQATIQESYGNYEKNAKTIAQNWPFIYDAYCMYYEEPYVIQLYIKYLAKLLASRESRFPVENYVLMLAEGEFNAVEPEFNPTDVQLQKGISSLSLKKEFIEKNKKHINALESRYRKRKLMVKLKSDTPKVMIIKELLELSNIDPIDIKTHILLARLFGEYALTMKNHQKRTSIREQALKYCNLAYLTIDDYLDLQKIEKMKERDHIRAGFVKTISAIRLPLIKR